MSQQGVSCIKNRMEYVECRRCKRASINKAAARTEQASDGNGAMNRIGWCVSKSRYPMKLGLGICHSDSCGTQATSVQCACFNMGLAAIRLALPYYWWKHILSCMLLKMAIDPPYIVLCIRGLDNVLDDFGSALLTLH